MTRKKAMRVIDRAPYAQSLLKHAFDTPPRHDADLCGDPGLGNFAGGTAYRAHYGL